MAWYWTVRLRDRPRVQVVLPNAIYVEACGTETRSRWFYFCRLLIVEDLLRRLIGPRDIPAPDLSSRINVFLRDVKSSTSHPLPEVRARLGPTG